MDTTPHNLSTLFDQMGLSSDAVAIERFVHDHRPLDPEISLHRASWWTPAQADFLKEALKADSDWAMAVDELNALLRPAPEAT